MTLLTASTKVIILECHLNSDRDTVAIVEHLAKAFNLKVGEHEDHEWVQVMHMRQINVNEEVVNGRGRD